MTDCFSGEAPPLAQIKKKSNTRREQHVNKVFTVET